MKIDLHAHILPPSWPDLAERYGYGGWIQLEHDPAASGCQKLARMVRNRENFRTVTENLYDVDARLAEMDAHRVDVQVLSTVPVMFSYWAAPEHTLDLCRLLNDHLAGVVARHPKRFVGLGTLPLQDADRACQELVRCRRELGFPGVIIGSNVGGFNLDDARFEPFWAEAERQDAAIFVHPWDMLGRERMEHYWMPWLVGMTAETALAICSVMMGGVLERFPRLKLLFAHGGGAFPHTLGRICHGFDVRPDLCQSRTKTSPRELVRRIWIDSLVHHEDALEYLIRVFGADRIALGTDYPFPLGELHPGRLIESATCLEAATREQLLSATALSFLGLERAAFETEASRAHSASLERGEPPPDAPPIATPPVGASSPFPEAS